MESSGSSSDSDSSVGAGTSTGEMETAVSSEVSAVEEPTYYVPSERKIPAESLASFVQNDKEKLEAVRRALGDIISQSESAWKIAQADVVK